MHPFRARSGSVRASGVRLHPVVAVQEQDPVARRPVDADVARRAQAAVLLVRANAIRLSSFVSYPVMLEKCSQHML